MFNKVICPHSPRNPISYVVSSGISTDEFPDKHPREWTKQALISIEEAMEA
jgi:hypothetical protein